MVQYDAQVLQQFANRLYDKARNLEFGMAFQWGGIGFVLVYIAMSSTMKPKEQNVIIPIFIALFAALAGAARGRYKAFSLRLEAQRVLCQVQIEKHLSEKSANAAQPHG